MIDSLRFRPDDFRAVVQIGCLLLGATAYAQRTIPITGDRLSGFVLPIEPLSADIDLGALRAFGWDVDDTKRLVLEGQVTVKIGTQTFSGKAAVVWLNRIPSAEGLINQLAIYFDELEDPSKASGLEVSGREVLLTASTRGAVHLNVALLHHRRPTGKPAALARRGEARLARYLRGLLADPPPLQRQPQLDAIVPEPPAPPEPGAPVRPPPEPPLPGKVALPPAETPTPPLFAPRGTLHFTARETTVMTGPAGLGRDM